MGMLGYGARCIFKASGVIFGYNQPQNSRKSHRQLVSWRGLLQQQRFLYVSQTVSVFALSDPAF